MNDTVRWFRSVLRVLMFGLASYNVGARDWRGLLGCLVVWACVEGGLWFDLRHAKIAGRRRRVYRDIGGGSLVMDTETHARLHRGDDPHPHHALIPWDRIIE